jgi:hypothetical protein
MGRDCQHVPSETLGHCKVCGAALAEAVGRPPAPVAAAPFTPATARVAARKPTRAQAEGA